ncbi:MAG TPA: protein-export chaperone SecB [Alphaproteobacteria bacterium]|nr:protein-export chaperone SecB [Alphaproteobacteria bacterium]
MAEPTPSAPQPAGPAAPEGVSLAVNLQYIKDLSFENPRAPQVFSGQGGQPQVQVGVDVGARQIGDKTYEVTLTVNAEAKVANESAFVVELVYAGLFTVTGLPQEQLAPVLLIECPRLLFPFAREIVASATRDGGFPPLLINPIDFVALYRRQAQQKQAAAQGDAAKTPIN